MISIKYSLLSKAKATNKYEIVARISLASNNRPTLRTGVYVKKEYFKTVRTNGHGEIKDIVIPRQTAFNREDVNDVKLAKRELELWSCRICKICEVADSDNFEINKEFLNKCLKLCKDLSVEDINRTVLFTTSCPEHLLIGKSSKSIYQLAEEYIHVKKFSESHTKAFKVLVRALRRFELYIQVRKDQNFVLDVDTISEDNVNDFFIYIQNEHILAKKDKSLFEQLLKSAPIEISPKHHSPQISQRGDNTIVKFKKKLSAFFRWLNRSHITKNNPTLNLEIGIEKYGTPICLDIDERDTIATFNFDDNGRLSVQRDIFIFQCLTGCRVGDLMKLTRNNIKDGILIYMPHKTKDRNNVREAIIPLDPLVLDLIDKYDGIDRNGRLFPFISAQKYNMAIKEILTACGITRAVYIRNTITGEYEQKNLNEIASSHIARKTFINSLYKKVQDPEIIGQMSGHVEGSRAFARYRNISVDILRETISKIAPKNYTRA